MSIYLFWPFNAAVGGYIERFQVQLNQTNSINHIIHGHSQTRGNRCRESSQTKCTLDKRTLPHSRASNYGNINVGHSASRLGLNMRILISVCPIYMDEGHIRVDLQNCQLLAFWVSGVVNHLRLVDPPPPPGNDLNMLQTSIPLLEIQNWAIGSV
jgi:hypothetical protein